MNSAVAAKQPIEAVGSSTVHPFADRVAAEFAKPTGRSLPVELSTGIGEGLQRFCAGSRDTHKRRKRDNNVRLTVSLVVVNSARFNTW